MSKPSKQYARALTIATSDSGGGAGVQADLKAFSAMGCYGMSVFAALTAQNTTDVTGIHALPPDFVSLQIDTVIEDLGVDAVKIGMLFNSEIMEAVADRLAAHNVGNVVLDPVMVAKSGAKLIQDDAIETLKTQLFPLSTNITPNLPEAETLLDIKIDDRTQMEGAARKLLDFGPDSVLLKGGHFSDKKSIDCLVLGEKDVNGKDVYWYEAERIHTKNTHGTGCTLSSAIAAGLAKGEPLPEAVQSAKKYISGAIESGSEYSIGNGHGPLHHFYQWWE
ncbi:bifunctional hydroxymethylpyrimidine kinase/phosphomethylpyrimidine kinase [Aliifodinibius sp. S!AR15-10]|uniref:bifunctional hydroxymethylpyrimidine kinase/phosphomethylpyrimidine kinase n=1 Tax=Aliifodinibius sp. S!AR15-10 TaxID=2950437 RepID=UPI00285E87BD|nr:bifunctional hydroxymethylpyrimidine kinase/phosphomethylpyrimidine kinase [Aliifodinibius sp. S!AR15-10]MDR8393676.1 bifunctional hydroxymethylpyrimidine kinase/phosphomethylpyrimidine kinase [Aliifodinibius sp. S!AR15-10]